MKRPLFYLVPLLALLPACSGAPGAGDKAFLDLVGKQSFQYFVDCMDPATGLALDKASNIKAPDFSSSPASIAASGFGLASLAVGAERGWMDREEARKRVLNTLRFFSTKMESVHGFYYHFVDMRTGKRVWNCELSSIDTALFLAGALTAAEYFGDGEIKKLADELYARADWKWMANGGKFLCMGWKPESGFLTSYWDDFNESMVMYVLALGSPTHPLKGDSWRAIQRLRGVYGGHELIMAGPLFIHQFSHIFIDFKGKSDGFADYFLNSREATLANRRFCMDNSEEYKTYGKNSWGLTACIGPDGYMAYRAPPGPVSHDGTVAPAAAAASIVFTPEESLAALKHFYKEHKAKLWGRYGFADSFNLDRGFWAEDAYGINQGPMLLMLENYRSGLVWQAFMRLPAVQAGMAEAGFGGPYVRLNRDSVPRADIAVYMTSKRPSLALAAVAEGPRGLDSPLWSSGQKIKLDGKVIQYGLELQPGYEAEATLLATKDTLFVKIQVADSELVSSDRDNFYEDDSVELYIDSANDNLRWGGTGDYQLIFAPGRNGKIRAGEFFHHKGRSPAGLKILGYAAAPAGYSLAAALDRAAFGLKDGAAGFSVGAHNVDKILGSDTKYNWFFQEPAIRLGELRIGGAK
jgi:hypothetical protein